MSSNVSGDVSPEYLTSRNYDYTIKAMPAILFLAFTLLVGFVGNSLVCYEYLVKIKRTNAFANFILALAVLDLANCVTNIPFEVFHLSHRYTIGTYSLCYIKSVTNNLISLMSAIILLPMTVDRYRRVCRPLHRQMTASGAKLSIGLCCVATCILSVPCLFVYGPRNIPLNEGRINGTLCSISDKAGVFVPLVYNGVVLVVFMAVFVTVVVVYSLIWCQLSQVTRFRTSSTSGRIPSRTTLGINGEVVGRGKDLTRKRIASESDLLSTRSAMTQQQRNTVRQRTVMMFLISLVFVLSFLPHFGTMIAAIFTKYVFDNLPKAQLALNNILLRSYFINSASNPIIYSICCVTFRRAIKKSFTRRRHSKTRSTGDFCEMKRLQCISPQSPHPSVPEQTHSHSTTDVPEQTQSHSTTDVPEQTQSHSTTDVPEQTHSHSTTDVPEQTQSHSTTDVPEQTQSHSTTDVPEQTHSHSTTDVPEQTHSHSTLDVPEQTHSHSIPDVPWDKHSHSTPDVPEQTHRHSTSHVPGDKHSHSTSHPTPDIP